MFLSVLGIVVSIFFLYLTFRKIDLGKVWETLKGVSLKWMVLGLFFQLCGFLSMSFRSNFFLKRFHSFSLFQIFKSVLVAFTGNNIFPLRAGEFLRIDYLARKGRFAHSSALAIVLVERLLDLGFLALLFFLFLPLVVKRQPVNATIYFLGGGVILGVVSLFLISRFSKEILALADYILRPFSSRVRQFVLEKLGLFIDGLSALTSPLDTAGVFFFTILFWSCNSATVFCWLQAFGFSLPWYAPLAILTFTAFGAALPSAPGFIGTYHFFTKMALLLFGIGGARADSFAILAHAFAFVPFTIVGIALLLPEYLAWKELSAPTPPPASNR